MLVRRERRRPVSGTVRTPLRSFYGPVRFSHHGMPPSQEKRKQLGTALQLGRTLIALTDDEFSNGFQVGYLHFKKDFQGKRMTDSFLYNVLAQNIIDVHRQDRCNAGYSLGFITARADQPPQSRLTRIAASH